MFYAIASWVLYQLVITEYKSDSSKKNKFMTFGAHLCLCLVHYFGLIFSLLVIFSYITKFKNDFYKYKTLFPILLSTVTILPVILYLIINQSSHLNTWTKPNNLVNFIDSTNNVMQYSLIGIALLVIPLMIKCNFASPALKKFVHKKENIIILTSFLATYTLIILDSFTYI